jgi:hypothetical protein
LITEKGLLRTPFCEAKGVESSQMIVPSRRPALRELKLLAEAPVAAVLHFSQAALAAPSRS